MNLDSTTTACDPAQEASHYQSGSESYTYRGERTLLDGVLRFFNYVFSRMATALNGLACGPQAVFHCIRDNRPDLGDLASNVFRRGWLFRHFCWHNFVLLGLKSLPETGPHRSDQEHTSAGGSQAKNTLPEHVGFGVAGEQGWVGAMRCSNFASGKDYSMSLIRKIRRFPVCPTVLSYDKLEPVAMDLEERIQQLCAQVLATDQNQELNRLCGELREALNDHIARLRERVADYRNSLEKIAPAKGD